MQGRPEVSVQDVALVLEDRGVRVLPNVNVAIRTETLVSGLAIFKWNIQVYVLDVNTVKKRIRQETDVATLVLVVFDSF